MVFVKVIKNKAYFKRYQVKYRRRREGKTDYRARRTMVLQDKTKYDQPKYRLVVRLTNRDVICQVVHSKIAGDQVLTAAYSHELPAFGLSVGLTNYAAAYCTGLLVARRTLEKLGIAKHFPGAEGEVTGAFKPVRTKKNDEGEEEGRFPFKAILDVGLARTTTGARVFGAMKGAVDGGMAVPHRPNRFPGYDKAKGELNSKVHRAHIFGQHVSDYMKLIEEEKQGNPDEVITQFSRFVAQGVKPESLEGMYKKVHAEIRKDPMRRLKKEKKEVASTGAGKAKRSVFHRPKLSLKQRNFAAKKKIAALRASLTK